MPRIRDLSVGAILALTGVLAAVESSTFEVAFLTDPVGPKALPYLASGILILAGAVLMVRPGRAAVGPGSTALPRMALATVAFLAYGGLLPSLGFTPATTLAVGALSILFGGDWRKSLASAFALSVALWYLFVWVLALPLPLGSLWTR